MTPINPVPTGTLPADQSMFTPADPNRPPASSMDDVVGIVPDAVVDTYAAPYEQPATTAGPTLDDFAAIPGIMPGDLQMIANAGLPPEEAVALYYQLAAASQQLMASQGGTTTVPPATMPNPIPEVQEGYIPPATMPNPVPETQEGYVPPATMPGTEGMPIVPAPVDEQGMPQGQQPGGPGEQQGPGGPQADPAGQGEAGKPGWNEKWANKFRKEFDKLGLDSATKVMLIDQLSKLGLSDQDVQMAFQYYTQTPEGVAELQATDEQAKKAGDGGMFTAAALGLTGGVTAIAVKLAKSEKNLISSLTKVAESGDEVKSAAAKKLLEQIKTGTIDDVAKYHAAEALRGTALKTNRLLHPVEKMRLNGAARNLTPASKLTGKELLRRAVFMDYGDKVVPPPGALAKGGGAGAASTAARGAGMLTKSGGAMRVLGPVGIAASGVMGLFAVKNKVKAEGGFGPESKKELGYQSGSLGGAVGGAAAGAALGTMVAPVIGTGIGAIAGGIAGGMGGGWIGKKLGGILG